MDSALVGNFPFQSDPIGDAQGLIAGGKFPVISTVIYQDAPLGLPEGFTTENFLREMGELAKTSSQASHEYHEITIAQSGHTKEGNTYTQVLAQDLPIHQEVLQYFHWLSNIETRIIRVSPGEHLTAHVDYLSGYYEAHKNIPEGSPVERYTIFLEDWIPGHFFFLGDQCLTWKKGDMVSPGDLPHGTSNCGYEPKWTLRVTGAKLD